MIQRPGKNSEAPSIAMDADGMILVASEEQGTLAAYVAVKRYTKTGQIISEPYVAGWFFGTNKRAPVIYPTSTDDYTFWSHGS